MKTKICQYCEQEFQASRFHPGQRVCGAEGCQRHRRGDYHRQKLAADSEYQETCRNSKEKWRRNNPDYMKKYRAERRNTDGVGNPRIGARAAEATGAQKQPGLGVENIALALVDEKEYNKT